MTLDFPRFATDTGRAAPAHGQRQGEDRFGPRTRARIDAMFKAAASRAPIVTWSPRPADAQNRLVRKFALAVEERALPGGTLPDDRFDFLEWTPFDDWLILLDVEDDGTTFRYSHFGTGIANIRGGSRVGETAASFGGHVAFFFQEVFRAVAAMGRPVQTIHDAPRAIFAGTWERWIVPLVDDAGEVRRILALMVPDTPLSAGLEIVPDPVLILDENQIVRFANRAARETFGRQIYLGSDLDLFQFAGIDLVLPQTPLHLAHSGRVHDSVSVGLRDGIVRHFDVTVSGMLQWGTAFYVAILRPRRDRADTAKPA